MGDVTRPLLLDGFCKAGGAGTGYHRAGFDILGVDIQPQPHYPFRFVQADMLQFLASASLAGVAAIHVSPVCKRYSASTPERTRASHPDQIGPVRELLARSGRPWVIENVPGAPMRPDLKLCGCMFGLRTPAGQLIRERWFETSWRAFEMRPGCHHVGRAISVTGTGATKSRQRHATFADWRQLMGIDWMTGAEMSQAIPPAYTEHVGRQLIGVLAVTR